MRRCIAVSCLAILTACGSTPPTGGTPPAGAPATITLVSGDGQTAAPAAALPVKLAVLVKDGSGVPVPGVVVHFAIDSGGGSLSSASATTGTDGTAGGVTWTLGIGSGSNVVAVTVNSLSALRFHATATGPAARTILANTPVGAAGGTFTYTRAGDALSGLTVTVMPGSFATTTTWSIVADTSLTVPLPAGFSQVGPTLVINSGQGFADSNMTLTMPMQIGANMAVAPFYYDAASGTLEGIPIVGRTDTSATLATRHFSADLMAIPGSGAVGSLRASLRQGFGAVRVVWVAIPDAQLVGTFTTSFLPGVDDWEFANWGDYTSPHGDCEGMSITAMYYHYLFRLGRSPAPGLYHHYDQSIANQWDNVQGIRYAGSVQADAIDHFTPTVNQISQLWQTAINNQVIARNLTTTWITLTLKLTGRPVLISLQGVGVGHAVVAYAVTSDGIFTDVSVADPNRPGVTGITLAYISGVMTPVNFAPSTQYQPIVFLESYALGVSAEISLTQLATRWAEFTRGSAGADRYPKQYRVDIENQFDRTWSPLTASVVSYSQQVDMRMVCTDCAANSADSIQRLVIWNAAGSAAVLPRSFQLAVGPPVSFNAVEGAVRGAATDTGFVDVMPFSIVYQPVSIAGPATWDPDVPLTFTVQNPPNVAGAHYQFEWDFGDGTAHAIANDNPNMNHTYATIGSPTVSVAITDLQTGHVIARAGISNSVASAPFIDLTVSGTWANNTAPALGNYHFTDFNGGRLPNASPGVDALGGGYDRGHVSNNGGTSTGILILLVIPAGSALHAGQTFTKFVTGPPIIGIGQFQFTTVFDLSDPDNSPQVAPGTSGTFTVTAITIAADGTGFLSYTFSVTNGAGGMITGSGVSPYK